jgi:hypothetical protein
MSDFTIQRDTDQTFIFTVKDGTSVVDITDATVTFGIVSEHADFSGDLDTVVSGAIISASVGSGITLSEPTSGQFTLVLADTDTHNRAVGTYYYIARVKTAASGTLPIPRGECTIAT